MINNEEVRGLAKHMRVSDKQLKFLELYEETLNVNQSAKDAGLLESNIRRDLRSKTSAFAKLFRTLSDNLENDPRFSRIGSISMLLDLKKRAQQEGNHGLEFKIIQEINKMIEGNLAATKKIVENVDIQVGGIIDLSRPPSQPKTIDIKHSEI